MTDPDLTTLALGTDLTTLGLNLNSPDSLHKTFASPWSDGPLKPEPEFKVRLVLRHHPDGQLTRPATDYDGPIVSWIGVLVLHNRMHSTLCVASACVPGRKANSGGLVQVPSCYLHQPPRLQAGYFAKFQQDTLFYIFYSMPADEAQLLAADELSARQWWYHKVRTSVSLHSRLC